MDRKNHAGAGFQNYTIFSLWDTYRAEHPLLNLIQPQRVDDMVQSMLAEYKESGNHSTPIWPLWGNETWCMIGYHSVAVIAEAYLKGFRGFDAEEAYQALRDTAMQDRNGLKSYRELGYVASSRGGEATSRTIEYPSMTGAWPAWPRRWDTRKMPSSFISVRPTTAISSTATVGFFRGRKADGSWRKPFNAHRIGRRRIHRGRRLAVCFWRPAGRAGPDKPVWRRRGLRAAARSDVQR